MNSTSYTINYIIFEPITTVRPTMDDVVFKSNFSIQSKSDL